MSKILIVSSNIHQELAAKQLANCLKIVKASAYDFQIETVEAGTYEIPFVIQAYHKNHSFDGYIALGLVLKKNPDHYDYIMSHIKTCFTKFALKNIAVGNGIITGSDIQELATNIDSSDPCLSAYPSALHAVDYLIKLKNRLQE